MVPTRWRAMQRGCTSVATASKDLKHEAVARPAGGHFLGLQLEIDLW
jgi:hypothetical protein